MVPPPVAVAVRVKEPPEQNVVAPPALTVGAEGIGLAVTLTGVLEAELQPLELVILTV
jgi:hypothetical protein